MRLAVRKAHSVDELLGVQRLGPDGSRALDAAIERALRGSDRRLEAVLEDQMRAPWPIVGWSMPANTSS